MPTIAFINANTNAETTERMMAVARSSLPPEIRLEGLTAATGLPLIVNEAQLDEAETAVLAMLPQLRAGFDGVVIAAFGDPGLAELRSSLDIPVVGIGESALLAAGRTGERFCVVTMTPDLAAAINRAVDELGISDRYGGVFLTGGDLEKTMGDPDRLVDELWAALHRARDVEGVTVAVVGGAPLADAGRTIATSERTTIIEPISCAMREIVARMIAAGRHQVGRD